MIKKIDTSFGTNIFHNIDISHFPTNYSNVKVKRTRIPNSLLNLSLSFFRWPKVDHLLGEKIDVFWVPDPRPAPVSGNCKKIVTFHDLSFEDFKYSFNLKTRLWHMLLRPQKEAEEARQIIAVSQFTRDQLIQEYDIPIEKIEVIYEAAPSSVLPITLPKGFEIIQRKYNLPDRYFLCLSTLEPRKNIKGVIEAYLEWQKETRADVDLVIAGQAYPNIFSEMDIQTHPPYSFTRIY